MTIWFIFIWHFNVLVWGVLFWKLSGLKLCSPREVLTLQLTVWNNIKYLRCYRGCELCHRHLFAINIILSSKQFILITWHRVCIRLEFSESSSNILCSFDYGMRQPRETSLRQISKEKKTAADSTCEPKSTEEFNYKSTWNSRVANASGRMRPKRAHVKTC